MGIVWLADEAVSTENANLFDYRIFGIVPLAFVRTSVFPEFRQFKVSAVSSAMPAISCPSVFHTPSFFHHSQLFFILSLGTSLSCAIHLAFFLLRLFLIFTTLLAIHLLIILLIKRFIAQHHRSSHLESL